MLLLLNCEYIDRLGFQTLVNEVSLFFGVPRESVTVSWNYSEGEQEQRVRFPCFGLSTEVENLEEKFERFRPRYRQFVQAFKRMREGMLQQR